MAWQQWAYLILAVVGVAYVATTIGKPRDPFTGRELSIQIIAQALIVALVLSI